MMKNKCHIRFTTLRRALILPFFIGVFSLLCFTTGQSQVKYKAKNASKPMTKANLNLKDSLTESLGSANLVNVDSSFTIDSTKVSLPGDMTYSINSSSVSKQQLEKAMDDCSRQTAIAINELKKLLAKNNFPIKKEELNLAFKSLDINGSGSNIGQLPFSDEFLSSITKEDLKSLLNCLSEMKANVDRLRKDGSTAIKVNGFQQQVMSLFQNQLFSKILSEAMQMSMPKFDSKPQSHKLVTTKFDDSSITNFYDDGSTKTTQIKTPSPELSQAEKERKELDDKIWREARRLKTPEFVISDIPFENSNDEKLVRIVRSKKETKVTYAIPIFKNEWWIYLSTGLTIVDKKTKDRYVVRREENGLPLNQILVVTGSTYKMIEITEVFPPLKESVEMIDILTLTSDFPNIIMGTRGKDTEFRNINVSDYSKESVGKVYR